MLEQQLHRARMEERDLEDLVVEQEQLAGLDLSRLEYIRVRFHKCRFTRCDFSRAVFYESAFEGCDFSNCSFLDTVWNKSQVNGCKGDGGKFIGSRWKDCVVTDSTFRYGNFSKSQWSRSTLTGCDLQEAALAEARVAGLEAHSTSFLGADFFRTPLKGVDLSDCQIQGITVSESLQELRGLRINPGQAVDLVPLMGIQLL